MRRFNDIEIEGSEWDFGNVTAYGEFFWCDSEEEARAAQINMGGSIIKRQVWYGKIEQADGDPMTEELQALLEGE